MRFLVDMNIAPGVAEWLRASGHDAAHVREQGLASAPDPDLFSMAAREDRIVVTFDLGFGEIIAASGERRVSVVLFRTRSVRKAYLIERLRQVLPAAEETLAGGAVVVVEDARHRIRRLPVGK